MKHTLAENMRRFNTKNLSETNLQDLEYGGNRDPKTGNVVGKMNLEPLLNESRTINQNSLETNGIAYDSVSKKIMVTGKLWPTIYEISMIPPQNN